MLKRRKDKEKKTGVKSNKKPASFNQIFSCLGNFFNVSNRLEVTNWTNFTVCEQKATNELSSCDTPTPRADLIKFLDEILSMTTLSNIF